jgi:hypothetical protein
MALDKVITSQIIASLFHQPATNTPDAIPLEATPATRGPDAELESLRANTERLLMITEALWTMLKDQFEYTDAHLIQRITEIDARDGRVDGRVSKSPPPACPKCQRPVSRRGAMCLYCGTTIPPEPFAR